MSNTKEVVDLLISRRSLFDDEISKKLRIKKIDVQVAIYSINVNKKKYKEFSIIRSGKHGNYVRELITRDSNENDIIDSADKDGKKAIKKLDSRRKKVLIGLNTRQGQKNRARLLENVLRQNLEISIQAQTLLQ